MGRKQKLKQERREQQAGRGKPSTGLKPGPRVRHTWLWVVLGVFLLLVAAAVVLFVRNQSQLFQMAMLTQSYQVDAQLRAHLGQFTTEDGQRLEAVLHEVQAVCNLPGFDTRAAGQLKFVLGVIDEIVRAGDLEPGEIGKLEVQVQAARDYLRRQDHPRRP